MSSLILLSRVTHPFGVRGWVRVTRFDFYPLVCPCVVFLSSVQIESSCLDISGVSLEECCKKGNGFVMKFSHCNDRDAALSLKGYFIYLDRESLPLLQAEEYYDQDLIGLSVLDLNQQFCGTVIDVFQQPAHAILSIQMPDKVIVLVPFVSEWVTEVCLISKHLLIPDFALHLPQ